MASQQFFLISQGIENTSQSSNLKPKERWAPVWTKRTQTFVARQIELYRLPGTVQNEDARSIVCQVFRISGQPLQRSKSSLAFVNEGLWWVHRCQDCGASPAAKCHISQWKDKVKHPKWIAKGWEWENLRGWNTWESQIQGALVLAGFSPPQTTTGSHRELGENSV